jgi:hypothetical protein
MTTVNPSGVDVFCPLFSVGFTYGYLRPGPSRGHIHLPYPVVSKNSMPLKTQQVGNLFSPDLPHVTIHSGMLRCHHESDTRSLGVLLISLAGWLNQHQRDVIDYLEEENRVLVAPG